MLKIVCLVEHRVETRSGHPSQPGLSRFIKYPGLTQILHWVTCINNGVWSKPKQ